MRKYDRDIWDDAVRSKLEDFEVDTMAGDWDTIVDRLPAQASISLRRRLGYWAAAAVASILLLSGGLYLLDNEMENLTAYEDASQVKENQSVGASVFLATPTEDVASGNSEQKSDLNMVLAKRANRSVERAPLAMASFRSAEPQSAAEQVDDEPIVSDMSADLESDEDSDVDAESVVVVERALIADASTDDVEPKRGKAARARKWGFGMGGGGLSMGADNLIPQYVTNSSALKSESLMSLNAFNIDSKEPAKTNVKHRTPIGIGFTVSRYLNNRFSLQSGLTYSYLRSEWNTNNTYHIKNDQRLHFIGIPLSVTYKIAEWNRFMLYASAGGMAEVNVAGKRRMKLFSDELEIAKQSEHVRMKEWLWSLNARTGVSYPIIRFISAFAEVGASYYFDNGSEIETIHSEKPFNVSLQFGFRFGF